MILPAAKAYNILDYETCYGYRTDTLYHKGSGSAFFTHNEKVGFWVKIDEPTTELSMRVVWTDPDGKQYDSNAVEIIQIEGENWGIVFDSIYIYGTSVENKKGVWTVELTIGSVVEAAKEFQILDYNSIVADFAVLRVQINTIQMGYDTLQAQNQENIQKYTELQADYNELLQNPPNSEATEELQDQYDEMYRNYLQLQANLGTTKMMMYGAVVVAIASVAVAIYFGAIKRS
ncbi:hypothetical protein JXL21_07410 [Candidatus Bathyarchaeota archaeon]|nr:hypothetical protein [Candidatus Bathyarchaeota archaeon]